MVADLNQASFPVCEPLHRLVPPRGGGGRSRYSHCPPAAPAQPPNGDGLLSVLGVLLLVDLWLRWQHPTAQGTSVSVLFGALAMGMQVLGQTAAGRALCSLRVGFTPSGRAPEAGSAKRGSSLASPARPKPMSLSQANGLLCCPLFLLVTHLMKKYMYLTALLLSACAAAQAQVGPAPAQMVLPRASDGNGRGVDTTKVYDVVARMPALPTGGGSRAIVQALQQAVGWPAPGKETQRVVVEFIVDRTGRARQARLLKGASPAADEAVVAAVNKLPLFTPGSQKGEAVYVRFRVPVLVSLGF